MGAKGRQLKRVPFIGSIPPEVSPRTCLVHACSDFPCTRCSIKSISKNDGILSKFSLKEESLYTENIINY